MKEINPMYLSNHRFMDMRVDSVSQLLWIEALSIEVQVTLSHSDFISFGSVDKDTSHEMKAWWIGPH